MLMRQNDLISEYKKPKCLQLHKMSRRICNLQQRIAYMHKGWYYLRKKSPKPNG